MTMNYIGSVSILDRGDAPAQAVIDRNARSLAQRIADETKEELNKVMTRVQAIYNAMDTVEDLYFGHSMEFVTDLAELESILKDEIKKRQYQQQVTVFIVGYSDVCHQKFRLLQNINEFFKDNSKNIDEEDWFPTTPDMDMEEVSDTIEESLTYAHCLTKRLAELNKDMVTYMSTVAEKKASNKGRKKIDKALQQAKDDVLALNEKLLHLQKSVEERDEKNQILLKQMDLKSLELQKFKTAAELAKQKLAQLQKDYDEQVKKTEDVKTDMTKLLDRQISSLQASHRQEMEDFKKIMETEAKRLLTASSTLSASVKSKSFTQESSSGQLTPDTLSKQESNPEVKESKLSNKTDKKPSKSLGKSPTRNKGEKLGHRADRDVSDVAVQDEEGNPDKTTENSQAIRIDTQDADSKKQDLFNENLWKSLPPDQMGNKFTQYRKLATDKIKDLEDQLQLMLAKTKRKVNMLKAQFQEHKTKWESERKLLIDQVDQSLKLQSDAEHEADAAMNQLEQFITEQEKLEEVEESHVQKISSGLQPSKEDDILAEDHSSVTQQLSHLVQEAATVQISDESDPELLRLMQQTDDAKVQEMNARLGVSVSAPPAVDTEPIKLIRKEQGKILEKPTDSMKQDSSSTLSQNIPILAVPESNISVGSPVAGIDETIEVYTGSVSNNPEDEIDDTGHTGNVSKLLLEPPCIDLIESYPVDLHREKHISEFGAHAIEWQNSPRNLLERESTFGELETLTVVSESSELPFSKQSTNLSSVGRSRRILVQSTASVDGVKIEGTTEEEIRASSAQSRASLRQQFKAKLGEAKQAAEDRRSKSPAIQLPTELTIDDELILEEDDDLEEMSLNDIGTSPLDIIGAPNLPVVLLKDQKTSAMDPSLLKRTPSKALIQKIIKKGVSLLEHPLLKEYLRVFQGVLTFKDGVGKIFLDKDLMSAHQMITELETVAFDHNKKVMPQIMELTENILYVLEEMTSLVNNVFLMEREPLVSAPGTLPPPTSEPQLSSPTLLAEEVKVNPADALSRDSSSMSENIRLKELQEQFQQLKDQMEQERKFHQDQIQKNTVVMMELQGTINDLQRELSSLGKAPLRTKSDLSSGRGTAVIHKPVVPSSIMFTRLDSERNAKIMKKAVMNDRLNSERYKEAVAKMDEYISLPAQRLAHLVKKYVHHQRMKEIEENVRNASSLDEDVYEVLNKMVNLENKRANQWALKMDDMGSKRLNLANTLMETLDTIEQESGIFLIKPMFSYRGRESSAIYSGKINRLANIHRSLTPSKDPGTSSIPAPTPVPHYRLVRAEKSRQQQNYHSMHDLKFYKASEASENGDVKISGNGLIIPHPASTSMWNMHKSHSWKEVPAIHAQNTPKMLEMDINRMMIGQNNISSKIPFPQSDDLLVNAGHNTLRSYVTINRPTAALPGDWTDRRPSSGSSSSHSSGKKMAVSEVDKGIPALLPLSQPLPPISPVPGQDDHLRPSMESDDNDEPPESPPGSSIYQSTNGRSTGHSAPSRLDQQMSATHSDMEELE